MVGVVSIDGSFTSDAVEEARLAAVGRYRDLDVESDAVFEQIAALAARLFSAPMAKVTLVERDAIRLVAVYGFDRGSGLMPREDAICDLVVTGRVGHLVDDALASPETATRAFVRRWGVRFYACSPITDAQGHRLGTVTVMDTVPGSASGEQLGMLDDLAAVVAKHLDTARSSRDSLRSEERNRGVAESDREDARRDRDHARLDRDRARTDRDHAMRQRDSAEQERDLIQAYASTLQSTLIPPSLPSIDGAQLATHFRPASPRDVGGDFYDVFPLSEGRWGFFIGDVVGHGVQAAVATSLIRYTLRSAAWHYDDPIQVLSELNDVMMSELAPRRPCTVITGAIRADPHSDDFLITLGTGGHQPGLLLDPAESAAQHVRPSSGTMLGAFKDAPFSACSLRLRQGQTLLLFTDGIVEARRGRDAFDIDSLASFSQQRAHLDPSELVEDLATLTTKLEPDDDVAVLALRANRHAA